MEWMVWSTLNLPSKSGSGKACPMLCTGESMLLCQWICERMRKEKPGFLNGSSCIWQISHQLVGLLFEQLARKEGL